MSSYSWSYKLLHWLSAILFALMCFAFVGFYPQMSDADRTIMLIGHSSMGACLTAIILIRIGKRFVLKHPRPKHAQSTAKVKMAKTAHYAMYVFMVLVPLTGYTTANFHHLPVQLFGSILLNSIHDTDLFNTFRAIHVLCIQVLIALVVLHIGAAIRHKLVLKDKVLYSMRPWFIDKNSES
ncbi:cytochrome b [Pseudoalteromonas luteoviolacea]|uniref:Cytochrome b561 bacterial/Ni-hydrogenase domain-containing protein n=1 Tax=Pseudoalteromonas luteoviolacea DSM 6061 TaxID=1365250 RepID=A0A161XTR4_9GAMM|nr:cytochrome b/b6 domain-containing protein [Pseudoalteromonas luteoviolacea]KZN30708.1 hypothetical protein N475_24595 [Pseudoalteromonas luteoviolacea DSM 6061]KZN56233.1 hypothetical protein N474_13205 [Pseudoalteromonas luteoviolacea CPMOR-2]MBE0388435.1 hypothetical protein [Pseudoalteromonas luteoviolacea DSM 6061]